MRLGATDVAGLGRLSPLDCFKVRSYLRLKLQVNETMIATTQRGNSGVSVVCRHVDGGVVTSLSRLTEHVDRDIYLDLFILMTICASGMTGKAEPMRYFKFRG